MTEEICPNCDGTGKETPYCENCEGRGWVDDPKVDGDTLICSYCEDQECYDCAGIGYIDFIEDEDE